MAKGQVRGNREVRKPKKDKTAVLVPAPSGAQVKATVGNAPGSTKK